ncbi:hypothetical protein [Levilactobacillus phage ENFP1]|nr:hypothetical protein [Levilactobacillus phage ENFP1]
MSKVSMDQVAKYIIYVAKEKELPVTGVHFTCILYLICQSLIKEGRLTRSNFYNFYFSGYLSSEYTTFNHLSGIEEYRLICESKRIPELEDKYISILSNLCVNDFTLFASIRNNSYLMNKVYSGKELIIGYSDLEKEYFSSENNYNYNDYKVDLTVTFKAPWYLTKEENYDKLKESIINSIKEGQVSISSLKTKESKG